MIENGQVRQNPEGNRAIGYGGHMDYLLHWKNENDEPLFQSIEEVREFENFYKTIKWYELVTIDDIVGLNAKSITQIDYVAKAYSRWQEHRPTNISFLEQTNSVEEEVPYEEAMAG